MSKPTSVEDQIRECLYPTLGGNYTQEQEDEAVAKINRLIVEAKLEGFNIAFDSHDYDRLRAYKEQLTKELGDSNG